MKKAILLFIFIIFTQIISPQGNSLINLKENDILSVIPVITAEAKYILETNSKNSAAIKEDNDLKKILQNDADPYEVLKKKTSFLIFPKGYHYNKSLSVLVSAELSSPSVVYTITETDVFNDKPQDSIDLKTIGTLKELEENPDYKEKLTLFENDKNFYLKANFIPLESFISPDNKVKVAVIDNSLNLFVCKSNLYNGRMIVFYDNEFSGSNKKFNPISPAVEKVILKQKLTKEKYEALKNALILAKNDSQNLSMLDTPGMEGNNDFKTMLATRKNNALLYIKYSNILDSIFEIIFSTNK